MIDVTELYLKNKEGHVFRGNCVKCGELVSVRIEKGAMKGGKIWKRLADNGPYFKCPKCEAGFYVE